MRSSDLIYTTFSRGQGKELTEIRKEPPTIGRARQELDSEPQPQLLEEVQYRLGSSNYTASWAWQRSAPEKCGSSKSPWTGPGSMATRWRVLWRRAVRWGGGCRWAERRRRRGWRRGRADGRGGGSGGRSWRPRTAATVSDAGARATTVPCLRYRPHEDLNRAAAAAVVIVGVGGRTTVAETEKAAAAGRDAVEPPAEVGDGRLLTGVGEDCRRRYDRENIKNDCCFPQLRLVLLGFGGFYISFEFLYYRVSGSRFGGFFYKIILQKFKICKNYSGKILFWKLILLLPAPCQIFFKDGKFFSVFSHFF